ncbi:MAG: hypothetical protein KC547_14375, partial [Anaerolineae bacterium]|nr:hypothetical protein [Anaerolineae bacterium]
MTRRVVVTGMGMISPLGYNVAETWEKIVAGKSGVGPITRFDTSRFSVKIAAEVKNWDPAQFMPAKEARRRDAYQQFIAVAARECISDGGFAVDENAPGRSGVIVGSAVGGVSAYYDEAMMIFQTGDPRKITPFGIPMFMVNGGSDNVA